MPITRDEAITAVFRGVTENLEKTGTLEEAYMAFLSDAVEAISEAAEQDMALDMMIEAGVAAENVNAAALVSYHQAVHVAGAALMALAHFPHLDKIEKPLPIDFLDN